MASASGRCGRTKSRLPSTGRPAEGWNPGLADAACFATADPEGFLIGELDGAPAATVSCVNYGARFAFLGFYIVREDLRGRGYGLRIWNAAIAHAGRRVIGLDGVVAQQQNYQKSGFELAYANVRYGGAVVRAPGCAAGRCHRADQKSRWPLVDGLRRDTRSRLLMTKSHRSREVGVHFTLRSWACICPSRICSAAISTHGTGPWRASRRRRSAH